MGLICTKPCMDGKQDIKTQKKFSNKKVLRKDEEVLSEISDLESFDDNTSEASVCFPKEYIKQLKQKIQKIGNKERKERKHTIQVMKQQQKVLLFKPNQSTMDQTFDDNESISINQMARRESRQIDFQKNKRFRKQQRDKIRENLRRLQTAQEKLQQENKYGDNEEINTLKQEAQKQVQQLLETYNQQEQVYEDLNQAYGKLEYSFIQQSEMDESHDQKSQLLKDLDQ